MDEWRQSLLLPLPLPWSFSRSGRFPFWSMWWDFVLMLCFPLSCLFLWRFFDLLVTTTRQHTLVLSNRSKSVLFINTMWTINSYIIWTMTLSLEDTKLSVWSYIKKMSIFLQLVNVHKNCFHHIFFFSFFFSWRINCIPKSVHQGLMNTKLVSCQRVHHN